MGIIIGIGQTRPQTPYDHYYGIEWDVTVSNPKPKRIGKMEMHAYLPVQSLMRRCVLLDNGEVAYYLDPNDSTKKTDSSKANLDGSDGQVMVEIPEFYYKTEVDGSKRRFLMSPSKLPGFKKCDRFFVSAYEATVQRSTSKLASVVNASEDYRGGNNDKSKDGKFNSQLGRPATAISLKGAREFARKRGSSSWNCQTYQAQKVLFWLFAIEYCNFNSQDEFKPSLDGSGYRRGGLGVGVTDLDRWYLFGNYPPVPCGVTNELGNSTGVVEYLCEKSDDGSIPGQKLHAISYRGVENPFGNGWTLIDGVRVRSQSEKDGGISGLYVCRDKEKFGEPVNSIDYDFRGTISRDSGYIKDIVFGSHADVIASAVGGSSTTHFCDSFIITVPGVGVSEMILLMGAGAGEGAGAGLLFAHCRWGEGQYDRDVGTRLCYIP